MKRPAFALGLIASFAVASYAVLLAAGWIEGLYVRLERPALVAVAPVAMLVLWVAGSRTRARGLRTHLEDALLVTVVLALSAVAVGVEIGRPLDRLTIVAVVDRSRSIELVPDAEPGIEREIAAAQESMRDGDRIAVVAFGATAVTEQPPRRRNEPPLAQRAVVARDATDIEAALRRALAEVPPDSAARIVLVSDGVATRGDAMAGAAAALAARIPIDTFVLEQGTLADIRVVSVRTSSRADAGEPIELRVVTQSPREADVEVRVLLDGQPIRKGTARIGAGEDVLRLREKLPEAGLHRYDVEITALDATLDATGADNAQSAFVRVRGKASALVLEGDEGKAAFVVQALERAEMVVEEAGAVGFPADLGGLAAYDLVVVSDIAAGRLAPSQIDALATYVRDFGGGLILLGGDRSMGPGGWGRTPVEEISPVSFDLKQDRRRGSLAEVIAIDISGSMSVKVGDRTKLELANEAAARAAHLLTRADRLGVEHVDTEVHWTVPLAAVEDLAGIEAAIRSMPVGGGGILVPITLTEAYAALDADDSTLKHLLLFSDGNDADQVDEGLKLATDAFSRGITTSVIALGRGKDTATLEELSSLAGGRYYLIEDATRLPAIFAQETVLASRSAMSEQPFRAVVHAPGGPIAGVDFDAAPELGGYVVTIAKPRATVHLTGTDDDPLLATWSVGIGRCAAFTSDLKDRWGSEWTHWPGAATLLAQLARDVMRRAEDGRVRLEASATAGKLSVVASAIAGDGRRDSLRSLRATVAGPGGFSRDVVLEPTTVGTYTADVPLDRPGTYVVVAKDEQTGEPIGTTGAVLNAGEELRPTGSDVGLLERISAFTEGKPRPTLRDVFADRAARRFAYEDGTRAATVLAAFALLLAVAARKLGMPEALVALFERLRSRRRAKVPEPAIPHPSVSALLEKKRAAVSGRTSDERADAPVVVPPIAPRPPHVADVRTTSKPAAEHEKSAPDTDTARPSGERPMSTAELLLARRKAKK